jgi:hypothetical protein
MPTNSSRNGENWKLAKPPRSAVFALVVRPKTPSLGV